MVRKPLKFKLSESVTKIKHDWVIYKKCDDKNKVLGIQKRKTK